MSKKKKFFLYSSHVISVIVWYRFRWFEKKKRFFGKCEFRAIKIFKNSLWRVPLAPPRRSTRPTARRDGRGAYNNNNRCPRPPTPTRNTTPEKSSSFRAFRSGVNVRERSAAEFPVHGAHIHCSLSSDTRVQCSTRYTITRRTSI